MKYRSLRWPCDHPVKLVAGGRTFAGTLRNVADQGAMVVGVDGLAPGDRVRLSLPGGAIDTEVRWVVPGRCGLRFDRPLLPAELAAVRGQAVRMSAGQRRAWGQGLRELP